MVKISEQRVTDPLRLLIIEPDAVVARRLVGGLPAAWEVAIRSLEQLRDEDLGGVDLALGTVGPGGQGLTVPAIVRRRRPELPVLLIAPRGDAALAVEAIEAGATDFALTGGADLDLLPLAIEKCLAHHGVVKANARLQRELARSLEALAEKNGDLKMVIGQLEHKARTDELTGLANRRWLSAMLEGAWAEAVRHDLPIACLMIDLDSFKSYNDALGHQRGDELLRLAGQVIAANCRDVDVSARYGGDEFCLLMPHTEPGEAMLVAERLHRAFAEAAAAVRGEGPRVTMSIGLAHRRLSRPPGAEALIAHADEALYAAKSLGKSRVLVRGADGVFAPMIRG